MYEEARSEFSAALVGALQHLPDQAALYQVAAIGESFYAGRFDETVRRLRAR